MMYDKIVNPETGRKVYINSKLGKQIVTKYVQYSGGFFKIPDIKSDSIKILSAVKKSFYNKMTKKISSISPLNDENFMKFLHKSEVFLINEKQFFVDRMSKEKIDFSKVIDLSIDAKKIAYRIISYMLLISMNMHINYSDKSGNIFLQNTPLETFTESDSYVFSKQNLDDLGSSYRFSLFASRIYNPDNIFPNKFENNLKLVLYNPDHSKQNKIIIGDGEYTPFYAVYIDDESKSIIVVIRGTSDTKDAIIDILCNTIDVSFTSKNKIDKDINCHVHEGFYLASKIIVSAVKNIILDYMKLYVDYDVVITGHSLGGGTSIITGVLLFTDQLFNENDGYFSVNGVKRNLKVKAFAPGSTFTQSEEEMMEGNDPLHTFLNSNSNIDISSYVYYSDVVPRASAYSMINFFVIGQILRHLLIEGKDIDNFIQSPKKLLKKNLSLHFFKQVVMNKGINSKILSMDKLHELIEFVNLVIDRSSEKIEEFYVKHEKFNKLRTLIPGRIYLLIPPEKNPDYLKYHIQNIKSNQLSRPILFVSEYCLDNHHMENYSAALKALSDNNDCYPCNHKEQLSQL